MDFERQHKLCMEKYSPITRITRNLIKSPVEAPKNPIWIKAISRNWNKFTDPKQWVWCASFHLKWTQVTVYHVECFHLAAFIRSQAFCVYIFCETNKQNTLINKKHILFLFFFSFCMSFIFSVILWRSSYFIRSCYLKCFDFFLFCCFRRYSNLTSSKGANIILRCQKKTWARKKRKKFTLRKLSVMHQSYLEAKCFR